MSRETRKFSVVKEIHCKSMRSWRVEEETAVARSYLDADGTDYVAYGENLYSRI